MEAVEESGQKEIVIEEYVALENGSVAFASSDISPSSDTGHQLGPITSKSEDILNRFETEDIKLLNFEQLQRFVLLQQLQVLELQKKKLELDAINSNPILFDISALNISNLPNELWF